MRKLTLSEEQKDKLILHLTVKGLNNIQISDVLQKIKQKPTTLNILNSHKLNLSKLSLPLNEKHIISY